MSSHRLRIVLATALLVPLMLVGCAGASKGGTGGTLEGIQWKLANYMASGTLESVPKTGGVFAMFENGVISGQAVNSYRGSYTAKSSGALTISDISSTLMAGPPELQAVETVYFEALGKTASYTSDGATLKLFDADGNELLIFAKSEATLVGSWDVTGINNGKQAVQSVVSTSTVTMRFAEDGKLSGNASVNQYNTTYTTSGKNGISIEPASATLMAGPEDLMQQEAAFLAALTASKTWEIRGEDLTLRDASGATQITARSAK